MDVEPKFNNSPPSSNETSAPIYRLPIELLTKIIKYIPFTQWPALELVDPDLFLNATLHAWGSIRKVDVRRDFDCSELKANKYDGDHEDEMIKVALCRDISRKTASILNKLIERSPLITSLIGVPLLSEDPSFNTAAIGYISRFEHLETIEFAQNDFMRRVQIRWIRVSGGIHLVNLIDFIESTRSRATLKDISIRYCDVPDDAIDAGHFERLRAAFANDPLRQVLRMESFTVRRMNYNNANYENGELRLPPLNFLDTIDTTRMTKLSFELLQIEPAVLATLINGAPRLRHIDFAFLQPCSAECNGERLQANYNYWPQWNRIDN